MNARTLISTVQSEPSEQVRVYLDGAHVDLRIFEVFAGPARAFTPTRRGVTFPAAKLAELIEALQQAQSAIVGGEHD